jgi:hypothetical protein
MHCSGSHSNLAQQRFPMVNLYARTMVSKSIYETRRLHVLTGVNERYHDLSPTIRRPIFRQWLDRPEARQCRLELIEAELSEFSLIPSLIPVLTRAALGRN